MTGCDEQIKPPPSRLQFRPHNLLFPTVLEQILNFGTNWIPKIYLIVRIGQTEYQVITRSKKTIWVVFEYLKLFE